VGVEPPGGKNAVFLAIKNHNWTTRRVIGSRTWTAIDAAIRRSNPGSAMKRAKLAIQKIGTVGPVEEGT
jgi:hypothetical protein